MSLRKCRSEIDVLKMSFRKCSVENVVQKMTLKKCRSEIDVQKLTPNSEDLRILQTAEKHETKIKTLLIHDYKSLLRNVFHVHFHVFANIF